MIIKEYQTLPEITNSLQEVANRPSKDANISSKDAIRPLEVANSL
jgi:hypothetical protein